MRLLESRSESEQGVVLVFVALVLAVLLALLALAFNMGWLESKKSKAQAVNDNTALALAAAIPAYNSGDTVQLSTILESLNSQNKVVGNSSDTITMDDLVYYYVDFYPDNEGGGIRKTELGEPHPVGSGTINSSMINAIEVRKTYETSVFLNKFLGTSTTRADVGVNSLAMLGGPGCLSPDLPIAIGNCSVDGITPCNIGCEQEGVLVLGHPQSPEFPPNAYNYVWNASPNAQTCQEGIEEGVSDSFCIQSIVNLQGDGNPVIASCIAKLFEKCETEECAVENPWWVNVPIVSCASVPEEGELLGQVIGFTRIGITGVVAHPGACGGGGQSCKTGGGEFCEEPYLTGSIGNMRRACFVKSCDNLLLTGTAGGGVSCGLTPGMPALVN